MNEQPMRSACTTATRRTVLIGASNVTLALPAAITAAGAICGLPLEIFVAAGHGRSFGLHTRVLGRGLPPILTSGLWPALAERPTLATSAIVTDIGNDLLYGVPVAQIVEWVDECLSRLRPQTEHLVLTELPIASSAGMGPLRFLLARSLLVPTCRLTRVEVHRRAIELNERVIELAQRHHAQLLRPEDNWYGLDPIHIRRSQRPGAWSQLLAPWKSLSKAPKPMNDNPHSSAPLTAREVYWAARTARPLHWTRFGCLRQREQPCSELIDGTSLSLF